MTYRVGHHSTSDDSSAYRSMQEVDQWKQDNPISKFRKYLETKGLWSEEKEKEYQDAVRKEVLTAFSKAEKRKKPSLEHMFTDVYDDIPPHLKEQQEELLEHLKKYPNDYPTENHKV
jgi:2-oxoisovalerate dehydrogenase E1 component alpha subunit